MVDEVAVMRLSKTLKNLIQIRDLTVAQLSRRTRVPSQTIHNWLAGVPPRNLVQVKSVAVFFNVTLDDLLFGETGNRISGGSLQEEIHAGLYEVILRPTAAVEVAKLKIERKSGGSNV